MYRITQEFPRRTRIFGYRPFTSYGAIFHSLHLIVVLPHWAPTTPKDKSSGLDCSAFARHYLRNRIRFLFLWLLRCFTSPGLASFQIICIIRWGYPIRTFTGQSLFAAHRSLTQLTTSFIAYWHQGIHDALFVA